MNKPFNLAIPSLMLCCCAVIAACSATDDSSLPSDETALTEESADRLLQELEELAGAIEAVASTGTDPKIEAIWREMEPTREDPQIQELIATVHENDGAYIDSAESVALSMYLDSFDPVMDDLYSAEPSSVHDELAALRATMNLGQGPSDISPGAMKLGSNYCCYIDDPENGHVCWPMKTYKVWAANKCFALAANLLAPSASLANGTCDVNWCDNYW